MTTGLATNKGHANLVVWRAGAGKMYFVQWLGSVVVKHRSTAIMNAEIEGGRYRKNFSKLRIYRSFDTCLRWDWCKDWAQN